MCDTFKLFIILLFISINNSESVQNFTEVLQPYNGPNKAYFYYYVPEHTTLRTNFHKKPRILSDNFTPTIPKEKNEVVDELANSLATLHYQPVVVLIDDTCEALLNAEYFTNNLLNNPNIRNEFWIIKFNVSGVTSVLAQSRINLEQFKNYIKNEIITTPEMMSRTDGSVTFFAILKAVQILPKNSAILLLTGKRPIDEDLSQLTLTSLQQKQIRLFVVWNGLHTSQGQEEKLLKETATYSRGTFYLGYNNITTGCKKIQHSFSDEPVESKEEILIKKTLYNQEKLQFPIDYTVKSIDIIIEGEFHSAVLTSPSGYTTDLLKLMSVRLLSPGASTAHAQGWAHIRFNTTKVTKPVAGIWEVSIAGDGKEYNVSVLAQTELNIEAEVVEEPTYSSAPNKNKIYLNVNGKIAKIDNISVIDKMGRHIHSYDSNKNMKIQNENSTNFNLNISDNVTLPKESFYLQITGSTEQGEVFSRLSYVEPNRKTRDLPRIIIESSTQSNLLATAGSNPKVIFEVTNNFDRPIIVPFSVQDEKTMLRDLVPRSARIPSKGSIEVTVYTFVPPSSTLQYTDMITLTAYGEVRAQKSALLYINTGSSKLTDTTIPYLNYKYTSTCMEVPYSSCSSGIWAIEVTAQDAESGLLRVISEPAGLYSPNGYISGTKETVTLYYSNDCCQPYLDITAIDLNNNKRTYKADAYNATLSTGSIVAITLGVLLFVILVIIAAILIRKFCCKQKDSLDLPRYRGQVASSRF